MIWHATGKCTEPGKMQHLVNGRAWKNFDTKYLDFAKEPRNVRLGLAADGFNPFGNLSQAYSIWPVILTTYNLPSWLCMKESSFMLKLLIPGPKSSDKDIDQICSATLMEDDMLKAQIKVVDILCDLELIYPPVLFDIMIHLVIHLPLEALEGRPIRPRSHYFRDVTTKFNNPDRNVDPLPLTCQFQVFRSVCKSIGLRSIVRFDAQELKKVKWYVLHNSPEIDTYQSQFKSLFPNKDIKEEFPDWFGSQIRQCHVDNDKDPEVSTTSELFALDYGPTWTPISVNSYVVDGVRYVMHSRDERRTTQNNGFCSPGPDREMYYEDDPDIIHFNNSSDLPLSTTLNDLDNAALHIDSQSSEVDAPPDIIDVPDEDDDIIKDEDALPHDLADSDDEDLMNVDDDGVDKVYSNVARSYGGDGDGEDCPPPHHVPTGCGCCFANRGKGKRKPILGGTAAGQAKYPRQDLEPLVKGNC
ncbi:proton-dependent oligopeptide transporter family protein [Tanacetum coccineum]